MNDFSHNASVYAKDKGDDLKLLNGITDVEIIYVTDNHVFAQGKRFGRLWLLKGLTKEKRNSLFAIRRLQEEFSLRSDFIHPGLALAVGFENVKDLGPCIVEEWVEGPSLANLLQEGKLSKSERHRIMHEILTIVDYLDRHGITNLVFSPSDIKVRDIDRQVILTDFDTTGSERFCSIESIIRELCPQYSGLAQKYREGSQKRRKNMADLQKAIRRRERLPAVLTRLAISLTAVIIIAMVGFNIKTMTNATEEIHKDTAHLNLLHSDSQARLAMLTDSLKKLTDQKNQTQETIRRALLQKSIAEQIFLERCKIIDQHLADFDRRVVPMFNSTNAAYYDSILALHIRLRNIYFGSIKADLPIEIQDQLHSELGSYFIQNFSTCARGWYLNLQPK